MAHITENDYKKMAEAISDDLVQQKIPLNDSIRKLASSMDMSQEQVRRLCESSNNTTFNKLFQSKDKTASDRIVEFDVADADQVFADNIKEAAVSEPANAVAYFSEYRSLREETSIKQAALDAFDAHKGYYDDDDRNFSLMGKKQVSDDDLMFMHRHNDLANAPDNKYTRSLDLAKSQFPNHDNHALLAMRKHINDSFEPIKTASERHREVDRRTVRKTLDHLRHEKMASEMVYGDTLQTLKRRFARIYQDVPFSTFEKNAAALHGERVAPLLTELRRSMRMPAMTYNFETLQKTAGFVDDRAFEYSLLADAVAQSEKVATIVAGIAKLEALS
jgi:AraC-like DNA-binding protein